MRHIVLRVRQYLLTRLSEGSAQIDYSLGLHHRTGFDALKPGHSSSNAGAWTQPVTLIKRRGRPK